MKRAFWVLASVGMTWIGCARDPGRCCDQFSATEDAGIYCVAHKDAVFQFVRGGVSPGERRGRLEWFKGILKELEPLPNSDAMHERLARLEKSHPEFYVTYEKHHFWAARDTNLSPVLWGGLMLCGFHHAVYELDLEIPPPARHP